MLGSVERCGDMLPKRSPEMTPGPRGGENLGMGVNALYVLQSLKQRIPLRVSVMSTQERYPAEMIDLSC